MNECGNKTNQAADFRVPSFLNSQVLIKLSVLIPGTETRWRNETGAPTCDRCCRG